MTGLATARGAAWRGARLGAGLALGYALLFAAYAVGRSSAALLAAGPTSELAPTLALNALALIYLALACGTIAATGAALVGAGLSLVIRRIGRERGALGSPERMGWLGLGVAAVPIVGLHALLALALGGHLSPVYGPPYLFWVGLPSLLMLGAGVAAARDLRGIRR